MKEVKEYSDSCNNFTNTNVLIIIINYRIILNNS